MKIRMSGCVGRWFIMAELLVPVVCLWVARPAESSAVNASDFLNSIGACSAVSRRGESLANTIETVKYLGLRWIRTGYESGIPVADLLELHRQTGIRFSYGPKTVGYRELLAGGSNPLSRFGANSSKVEQQNIHFRSLSAAVQQFWSRPNRPLIGLDSHQLRSISVRGRRKLGK